MFDVTKNLFTMPENVETRWASPENPTGEKGKAAKKDNGRKGSAFFKLNSGESYVLAEEASACGTIRRIWITINNRGTKMLRGLRLDFYWDGAVKPAVSVPFSDFFGVGLGRITSFYSALFSSPEGRSFNCFVPMPFKKGMKIVLTNETDIDLGNVFYDIDYTIGDKHDDDMLYFHAYYNRENPTTLQRDFQILPQVFGKGRFLGCNIGVISDTKEYLTSWWGEGEVKMYIDGDSEYPTLCGTGVEDYVGTGWSGLGAATYSEPYQGTIIDDRDNLQVSLYRYHILDPIYFRKDIRVDIQQIGSWDPESKKLLHYSENAILSTKMEPLNLSKSGKTKSFGLFERSDDWSSCAYFYLDQPENNLPELQPVSERIKGLIEVHQDLSFTIEY